MNVEQVVDLKALRKEKQEIANRTLCSLYEKYFTYLDRSLNLREKVRAKHIFYHKVGIPFDQLDQRKWKLQFEHWLAFDYVTIMGSRLFDRFIREHREELTKPMLQISSFLYLMVIEPILIKKLNHEQEIIGINPFQDKTEVIESLYFPFSNLTEGDLILLRQTRSGYKQVALGPYMKVQQDQVKHVLSEIKTDFINANGDLIDRWRPFLKEYGIKYLKYME